MASDATAHLGWFSPGIDVVVLRWPEQGRDLERLNLLGIPRLLLVEPGAPSPSTDSPLEDWVRLPAEDADVRARLVSLARRAERQPNSPVLDKFGELTYRGRALYLSPVDRRIMRRLVDSWSMVVDGEDLRRTTWPDAANEQVLRVHISRLRRQLRPIGLTIICRRSAGYVLRPDVPDEAA